MSTEAVAEPKAPVVPNNSPLADYMERNPVVEPVIEPAIEGEPDKIVIPPASGDYSPVYKAAWEKLEKDGIKIPDDFKQGKYGEGVDEWDALQQTIIDNTDFEEDPAGQVDDPFVQNLMKLPVEQRDEYIRNYNEAQSFFNLPPTDGLTSWYKSLVKKDNQGNVVKDADGNEARMYSDDDIKKYVDGKSPIELDSEWNKVRGVAKNQFDAYYNKESADQVTKANERITNDNKARLEAAKTVIASIDTINEVGGIPLTPELRQKAKTNFLLLSQIDPKTGRTHIMNLLNDSKQFMNFVLANTVLSGNHVDDYLQSKMDNFKEILVNEKLDIQPKPKSGTVGPAAQANKPLP